MAAILGSEEGNELPQETNMDEEDDKEAVHGEKNEDDLQLHDEEEEEDEKI